MQKFTVTGMSCAACSARVERAVKSLPNVTACQVNLLTKSMAVSGDVDAKTIIKAVEEAGYGASSANSKAAKNDEDPEIAAKKEIQTIQSRLIASLILMIPLLYVSMGHMLLHLPIPAALSTHPVALGIVQLLLAAAIMVINQRFFIQGIRGLIHKAPNMDTLVCLGSGASFFWSVVVLLKESLAMGNGTPDYYFETAAMILTLITVGKLLEAKSKGKTTDALQHLLALAPKKATVLRNNQELDVDVADVAVGDIFLVRPGANIPVDGVILEGSSAVNEAALTGESIPIDKSVGDHVCAATSNTHGFLKCKATKVGEDTALAQIIQLVNDANATKAPIAKLADTISGFFVPLVLLIAGITILIWILAGAELDFALARGIAVLVISCPCALGLATPVAIMVGSGLGAKHGILFKTAESLEQTGRTQIVALDKTGTITQGTPTITDIVPNTNYSKDAILALAASLEAPSEHPIAKAIVAYAKKAGVSLTPVQDFAAHVGSGVSAKLSEKAYTIGKASYMAASAQIPKELLAKAEELSQSGKTPIFLAQESEILGLIAVADTLKEDSKEAIEQLKAMGIRVVMLTGDTKSTAYAMSKEAGVDTYVAEVLPADKDSIIQKLKEQAPTAMVGDGINDAPALTRADCGIAIGAGTDVALDAADIVLVTSRLTDVPAAIRLSKATLATIRQNLFWAFFYNIIGIPVAAGLLYPLFGITLNPILGAAAMSLSSFCVVTNALRLNTFNPKKAENKQIHATLPLETLAAITKPKTSTKIIGVQGMMCPHCEGRVKKALEAIPQVANAEASHTKGEVVVSLPGEIEEDSLRKAIEEAGYTVSGIQ